MEKIIIGEGENDKCYKCGREFSVGESAFQLNGAGRSYKLIHLVRSLLGLLSVYTQKMTFFITSPIIAIIIFITSFFPYKKKEQKSRLCMCFS